MFSREIRPGIRAVGAVDWDRRLFDELIPLPDGTSYNAYFIRGTEKTALIDTVDAPMAGEFIRNLKESGIDRIDYVIANHAEQDHSGALPDVLRAYPGAQVVTNPKCREFLMSLLPIPEERFATVQDETLSLGGRSLRFILAPWVHWPETMLTHLPEERILFTCDLFGSHLATSDLCAVDEARVYAAAKRYYAEIMMPFRASIQKHMEKLKSLEIEVIAPSHGPVYPRPEFILDAYRDWISDTVKGEVVIPYVSMHGSTKKMVDHFVHALMKREICAKPFNLVRADIGELAMATVDAATIVVGSPCFLGGAHPAAVYGASLINALKPKTQFASAIASYGWGGKVKEQIQGLLGNLKLDAFLEPVVIKGDPGEKDFLLLDRMADEIERRHRESARMR